MGSIFAFMAAPFAASLVLVGIHGYLGLHVLLRRVIFVDLALAQIAALGTVVAVIRGHDPGSWPAYTFSLLATLFGAAVLSATRVRRERIPQEALIGITYVVATAATILLADQSPEGAEHLRELLAGTILWVTWPKVLRAFLLYAAIGAFHYFIRKKLILISEDPERAYAEGLNLRAWDFLFYASFGVVITLAVQIGGVLMVFAYLVAPAIIALGSSDRWGPRIGIAWAVGFLASAAGMIASFQWDLPSGPAIVCALGVFLLLFAAWRKGRRLLAGGSPPSSPSPSTD
jgi:zinc/manganese transport system permease protein